MATDSPERSSDDGARGLVVFGLATVDKPEHRRSKCGGRYSASDLKQGQK